MEYASWSTVLSPTLPCNLNYFQKSAKISDLRCSSVNLQPLVSYFKKKVSCFKLAGKFKALLTNNSTLKN